MSSEDSTAAGPEAPATGAAAPERRTELDTLRALVVVGLVFFHSALVFDSRDDFYVKNGETTDATMVGAGLGVVWAMPALFLVAGLGTRHSLSRRGARGFVVERLLRLGVPLLFATLTLLPLPQWLHERSSHPGSGVSYPDFLPRFYDVHLEPGEFPFVVQGEHFETGHLWFVLLLLAFSLLLAPLVRWLPHAPVHAALTRAAVLTVRKPGSVLLAALPLAAICALLGLEESYGGWHRWAYLVFFLYGFVLACDERFRAAVRHDAGRAAVLGLALFVAALPGFLAADEPFTGMTPLATGTRACYGAAGWCWLVAILGLLDRRALARRARRSGIPDASAHADGRGERLYAWLAPAVLPLYVLHQPVVVAAAYFVVGGRAPMPVKYLAIVAVSLVVTVAVYELLVRRTRATRFLFGMRARPSAAPPPG